VHSKAVGKDMAIKALGPRAPIVALPSGDKDKYWHDRASGDWGRYVMREVIPQVTRRGDRSRRVRRRRGLRPPRRDRLDERAHASVHTWPGGHTRDYWDAHWADYLRFYARALARC
jgi:hypothetical protein